MVKLHLGCGETFLPGFIHVDARKFDHVDHVSAVDMLDFMEDGSTELIYASHLLEHFPRAHVKNVLKEWYRVLRPGGVLRVAVPDFEAVCVQYMEKGNIEELMGLIYGGQTYNENYLYCGFDFAYLKKLLVSVGFREIERYDWRETIHKDHDDFSQAYLPHMDKEYGRLMSLNVEAVK
jgi:ubiquinone/menaquinone biosynthesis C-methylase UbiE